MAWTDEYREIVEFYYWEPQHIGRSGGIKLFKSADAMWEHVSRIEVSLNHVLNVFFNLYPVERLGCFDAKAPLSMLSSAELEVINSQQKNATQPDMFFVGARSNLAVELKIASACSLQQLHKYIAFNQAISDKPLTLMLLTTTDDIRQVFKEHYASVEEINQHLSDDGLEIFPKLKLITYVDLLASLEALRPENYTEKTLIDGLAGYLQSRSELKI